MLKVTKYLCFFVGLLSASVWAEYEKSDSFYIKTYDEYVKVLSPVKYRDKTNIIIKNGTLDDLYGKVESVDGRINHFVTIRSGKIKSLELGILKSDQLKFIPLAPAFQTVHLIWGKRAYEIPAKR